MLLSLSKTSSRSSLVYAYEFHYQPETMCVFLVLISVLFGFRDEHWVLELHAQTSWSWLVFVPVKSINSPSWCKRPINWRGGGLSKGLRLALWAAICVTRSSRRGCRLLIWQPWNTGATHVMCQQETSHLCLNIEPTSSMLVQHEHSCRLFLNWASDSPATSFIVPQ